MQLNTRSTERTGSTSSTMFTLLPFANCLRKLLRKLLGVTKFYWQPFTKIFVLFYLFNLCSSTPATVSFLITRNLLRTWASNSRNFGHPFPVSAEKNTIAHCIQSRPCWSRTPHIIKDCGQRESEDKKCGDNVAPKVIHLISYSIQLVYLTLQFQCQGYMLQQEVPHNKQMVTTPSVAVRRRIGESSFASLYQIFFLHARFGSVASTSMITNARPRNSFGGWLFLETRKSLCSSCRQNSCTCHEVLA